MPRKMSAIMKDMAERLLLDPKGAVSTEADHAALLLSHVAWNRAIGLHHGNVEYTSMLQKFEASNPHLWEELTSNDCDALILEGCSTSGPTIRTISEGSWCAG